MSKTPHTLSADSPVRVKCGKARNEHNMFGGTTTATRPAFRRAVSIMCVIKAQSPVLLGGRTRRLLDWKR
jgi:hypothetical protein